MTPLPKRKHTSGRRDRRRSHDALKARNSVACPNCGERRMDWLVWQEPDYETVRCSTCGHEYTPA